MMRLSAMTLLSAASSRHPLRRPCPAQSRPVIGKEPQSAEDVYIPDPPVIEMSWVTGLEVPWALVFLLGNRALVTERPGRIRVIEDGRLREALLKLTIDTSVATPTVTRIERWFAKDDGTGIYGRLRDIVAGPDGALYVLTSNRDGRGSPREGDDRILRLVFPKE